MTVGFLTGLFGVGGGFLVIPALVLLLGLPMPVAVGTSLVIIVLNALAGFAAHAGAAWTTASPAGSAPPRWSAPWPPDAWPPDCPPTGCAAVSPT